MRVFCIVALLILSLSTHAAAQSVEVAGRVLTRDGEPVPEARVTLSAASGQAASSRSASDGSYRVALPAGTGALLLAVERVGFVTTRIPVQRPAGLAPLSLNVRLAAQPTLLAAIEARASRAPLNEGPGGTGATATGFHSGLAEFYAVDPGDLGAIASTRTGVVPLGAGDGSTAVSILGQPASATQTTVDGANFGAGGLPQEAIRKVGVVVTAYDVSRGQFTGGQLTAATHTGSNDPGGSLSLRFRGPPLQWAGARAAPLAETGWMQGSGGAGGALVRDRLFAFGAAQWTHRSAASPFGPDADGVIRGVPADSLSRALDVLRQNGLAAATLATGGPGSDAGSAIARLDGVLSRAHQVGLRLDGRLSRAGEVPLLGTAGTGAERTSGAGGVMASLVSAAGGASNELHAYASGGTQRTRPETAGPAGVVVVGGDGAGQPLEFGAGARASRATRSLLDVGDAFSLRLGGNTHRIQAGFAFVAERTRLTDLGNANGTFVFNSVQDLAGGTPSEFTRSLSFQPGVAETRYGALYAGHALQLHRLTLSYGVRAERLWYPGQDGDGPAGSVSGLAPGRVPVRTTLSPRLAFGYDFRNARGWSVGTLRGGVGRFVGRASADDLAGALGETGDGRVELVCVGPAAPRVDWAAYAGSPASVPAACADGGGAFASRAPRVSVFSPSYTAPRTWHASLFAQWQPVARAAVNVEAVLVRGDGTPVAFDRNLGPEPRFSLADKGGRGVYVAPSSIDPASGGVSFSASRRDPAYGTVREIGSGRSLTRQLMLGGFAVLERSTIVTASYVGTRSSNDVGALDAPGGSAALAGETPFALLRAPAEFERRHSLYASVTRPFGNHVRASLLARGTSGAPYTPLVQGDVNGDGAWNDAAFVFAPAAAGAPVGWVDALASLPPSARACLERQAGRVAARNGCRGPWAATVDAQALITPGRRPAVAPRLQLTVLASNLPGLADYLLHGQGGLRGWGQASAPDPTLLRVTGFDPVRGAFRYEVNRSFGRPFSSRFGTRQSFTLTLQARVAVGDDPARHWLAESNRAAFRYARSPGELMPLIVGRVDDLPVLVLEHDDSLHLALSPEQRARLRQIADSLHVRLLPMLDSLAHTASAADTVPTPSAPIRAEVRARSADVRAVLAETAGRVRAVLTPDQWNRLPAPWREPDPARPIVPMKPMIVESEEP